MMQTPPRLGRASLGLATILLLLPLLLPVTADADWFGHHRGRDEIEGSGNLVTKTLDLEDFDTIEVDGVVDIDISFGSEYRVELEAEDNLIDLFDARVRGRRLILDLDDDYEIDTEEGFRLTITMPALRELQVDGVTSVQARGFEGDELVIDIDGVGDIEIEGRVGMLDLQMDGVGSCDLRDLVAQDAEVDVDGVGTAHVHVTGELDASVDGMGKLRYYGDPERVREDEGGFGSIRRGR